MARSNGNIIMHKTKGAIGKQIVFKEVNGKTITAKYPDMSNVIYVEEQIKYRNLFSKAVKFAQGVLKDKDQTAIYQKKIRNAKGKHGTSIFHLAIKEFMKAHSQRIPKHTVKNSLQNYIQAYNLSDRQIKGVEHLIKHGSLTNAIYQRLNTVSKPTATRDLQQLVQQGVVSSPATKGAGAVYSLKDLPS